MKLKVIGSSQTEVTIGGVIVFFSYNTPVACYVSNLVKGIDPGYYKTNKKFGRTTNKHINSWFMGVYEEKEQYFFDNLISGV